MYQNIYGNQINNNQPNANNYPKVNPQNQNPNQNKPNGNQKNIPNKKYADLEIQTFFNNESNTGLSAKDMQLKSELEILTNQYMSTFNTINELSKKFSQGNDNMYKVSMVQKDLEQMDFENGNEYGNFIGQLYDVTKNANLTNLAYDAYKRNPVEGDQKIKKVINDYKYDVILFTNKNTSQSNYNKLKNYVDEQKRKQNYYNKTGSWELTYPNYQENGSAVNQRIIYYGANGNFGFSDTHDVIDDNGNVVGTANYGIDLRNGSLSGVEFWQTAQDVDAGDFHLEVDLAAFYRKVNYGHDTGVTETGVTFNIIDANGTTLVSKVVYCPNPSAPYKLKRHTFDFTQQTAGTLTFKIIVGPGTQNPNTADGSDPEIIPAYNQNPNRREVMMANVHLYKYTSDYQFVETTNRTETSEPVVEMESDASAIYGDVATHRSTLRKRTLFMPDVTIPTYGTGSTENPLTGRGNFTDNLPHTDRVSDKVANLRKASTQTKYPDSHYVGYTNVFWNGFTIRHGFVYDEGMGHGGGAGVNMYEGAHLQNCIITDNAVYSERVKGGGLFCDGATSSVEGCFILNNISSRGTYNTEQGQIFAGGMFMYEGTCFNTLIANNYSYANGGGLGLCVGRFYNNTIAYNSCAWGTGGGGLRIATGANSSILMANTIIYGNSGQSISMTQASGVEYSPFIHCFIQSKTAIEADIVKKAIYSHQTSGDGNYGIGNVFMDGENPSATTSPFSADVVEGVYSGGA